MIKRLSYAVVLLSALSACGQGSVAQPALPPHAPLSAISRFLVPSPSPTPAHGFILVATNATKTTALMVTINGRTRSITEAPVPSPCPANAQLWVGPVYPRTPWQNGSLPLYATSCSNRRTYELVDGTSVTAMPSPQPLAAEAAVLADSQLVALTPRNDQTTAIQSCSLQRCTRQDIIGTAQVGSQRGQMLAADPVGDRLWAAQRQYTLAVASLTFVHGRTPSAWGGYAPVQALSPAFTIAADSTGATFVDNREHAIEHLSPVGTFWSRPLGAATPYVVASAAAGYALLCPAAAWPANACAAGQAPSIYRNGRLDRNLTLGAPSSYLLNPLLSGDASVIAYATPGCYFYGYRIATGAAAFKAFTLPFCPQAMFSF